MYNGMPYNLLQGQGHRRQKVVKMANFKVYLHQFACNQETNVNYASRGQYLNFNQTVI